MSNDNITIRLNIQPDEYIQLNKLTKEKDVNKQPAGLNFYIKNWSVKERGSVLVDNAEYSFTIPNTLNSMGTYDVSYPQRGITSFSVSGGMSPHSEEYHDVIRLRFLSFLQHLLDIGWESYIYFSDPRLMPKDAVRYAFETDSAYILPASETLSLEQWMKMDGQNWQLHANGVFLSIDFKRDKTKMDVDKKGSYFFTYKFINTYKLAMGHLKYDDRPRVVELWPETLKKQHEYRYKTEDILRKQGVEIDTTYTDPEIILE